MQVKNRVPVLSNDLLGRAADLSRLKDLLVANKIVTVTGPGGIGKTSLALLASQELESVFVDGIYFIELASVKDSEEVLPTIARRLLGKSASSETDVLASLQLMLEDKRALLILDNFEQVTEAATEVAQLRQSLPDLPILITSRQSLRIRGEHELGLDTLSFPSSSEHFLKAAISEYPALDLFLTRIKERDPNFEITESSLSTAIAICKSLDGLPLALELAAARAKAIGLKSLAEQLEQGITILSQGPRDLPRRHQTLVGTIRWSYDLLTEADKQFFRGLSVFPETFSADAAQEILKPAGSAAIDHLTMLVEKSLVKLIPGTSRFTLLATIRQFAIDMASECNERDQLHQDHAQYYIDYLVRVRGLYYSNKATEWFDSIDLELANIHGALNYLLTLGKYLEAGQLVSKLWMWWKAAGRLREGSKYLEQILAHASEVDRTDLPRLYGAAANLSMIQGRSEEADAFSLQCLQAGRASGSMRELAASLNNHAMLIGIYFQRFEEAVPLLEESLSLGRELKDTHIIGQALLNLGGVAGNKEDFELAEKYFSEALTVFNPTKDTGSLAVVYGNLGITKQRTKNVAEAIPFLEKSVSFAVTIQDRSQLVQLQHNLALAYYLNGDRLKSVRSFADSARLAREMESPQWELRALMELVRLLNEDKKLDAARALATHVDQLLTKYSKSASLRKTILEERARFESFSEGLFAGGFVTDTQVIPTTELLQRIALSLERNTTLSLAAQEIAKSTGGTLESTTIKPADTVATNPALDSLSEREKEVLSLVAQGMKDSEIADKLFLSVRTVNAHIRSIYSKLNIKTRSQATRIALGEPV